MLRSVMPVMRPTLKSDVFEPCEDGLICARDGLSHRTVVVGKLSDRSVVCAVTVENVVAYWMLCPV